MKALFALGFRPFYLLAGLYAALSVPLWAAQYAGWMPGPGPLWHAHEMIFGYAFAVIAGFLLTGVRNWTARPTPSGAPLAVLAALWIAARLVAPYSLRASTTLDVLFSIAFAWGIGTPILLSGNRNWFFIPIVLALGVASVAFQAFPQIALAAGLDLVLLVVAGLLRVFWAMSAALLLLAILSFATAAQRVAHVHRNTRRAGVDQLGG